MGFSYVIYGVIYALLGLSEGCQASVFGLWYLAMGIEL